MLLKSFNTCSSIFVYLSIYIIFTELELFAFFCNTLSQVLHKVPRMIGIRCIDLDLIAK